MRAFLKTITGCLCLFAFCLNKAYSQSPIPKIVEKNGRHALLVDGKPYLILAGQAHNSSGWPVALPKVWDAIAQLHANTLEVPIYWEQIEPQPGKFDFSIVDAIITQARQHHVHLVLLWFATWKNGSNHYMPEWMKRDANKYPNITGRKQNYIDSPSPNSQAANEADIKAFATVMLHLKNTDAQHTVLMVQVENEPGSWGSVRDYGPTGQQLFEGNVPAQLLKPAILKALHASAQSGTWQQVFGERADEYFQAWSIATYIGKVAAAGKAVYPLPLYCNAALRDPLTDPPATNYESGGPTDNVIPIWKVAAPAIDLLAPDIYLSGTDRILKVIELYTRADNPLFVPEAGLIPDNAKYLYAVLASGGIGFSPFGIDDNPKEEAANLSAFGNEYEVMAPMAGELAAWAFQDKIMAVVEREDHAQQTVDLGAWQAIVTFGTGGRSPLNQNIKPIGKLMIIQLGYDKFNLIGTNCRVTFKPIGRDANRAWQYLKVAQGQYKAGIFKPGRTLNGDETDWGGPAFGDKPVVLQVSLVSR